jgi:transposase InsO family protein
MATPHRLRHHAGALRVVEWHVTSSLVEEDENDGRGTREAQRAVPDHKDRYTRVRPVQSAAGRSFTEPGSPWQNPFVESCGSRVRDEVLSAEAFDSVLEAQTVITDWRTIYNHRRPHSSLGWRPPAPYAASLTTNKSEKPARLS